MNYLEWPFAIGRESHTVIIYFIGFSYKNEANNVDHARCTERVVLLNTIKKILRLTQNKILKFQRIIKYLFALVNNTRNNCMFLIDEYSEFWRGVGLYTMTANQVQVSLYSRNCRSKFYLEYSAISIH